MTGEAASECGRAGDAVRPGRTTTPARTQTTDQPAGLERRPDRSDDPQPLGHEHPPRAAYVHVPFCRQRCPYCDFTVVAGRPELVERFFDALTVELERELVGLSTEPTDSPARPLRPGLPFELDSLFLGGGTPTFLSPAQLERLFELLGRYFSLAEGAEVTVEANPADLTPERLSTLKRLGVNRLSLGVQSFDDQVLRTLGRDHSAAEAVDSLQRALSAFDNVAVDLIFGVSGQTLEDWLQTLRQTIRLGPHHVSTYGLTFEKGTVFWKQRQKGQLQPVPEQLEREMYAAAMDRLSEAGYEHYELSNFARPGFRCRHNLVYWHGRPYFGFGPGAASYVRGRRVTRHRSVTTWLKKTLAGEPAVYEQEELDAEGRARELAFLQLRLVEGIDCDEFFRRTGFRLEELAGTAVERHCRAGLLERAGCFVRLTRAGLFLADLVAADFL